MDLELWAVIEDAGGAHEADGTCSVWTNRELAEAERTRLIVKARPYSGDAAVSRYHVVRIAADTPSDSWITAVGWPFGGQD